MAQEVNAACLFIAVAANLTIAPAEIINEGTFGTAPAKLELLAFHLFPYFSDSEDANEKSPKITPLHTQKCLHLLDELFTLRMLRTAMFRPIEQGTHVGRAIEAVRQHTEVVRGSAYPEQIAGKIKDIQGHFENQFKQHLGISPMRAQAVLWAISQAQEESLQKWIVDVQQAAQEFCDAWKKARTSTMRSQSSPKFDFLRRLPDKKTAWLWGCIQKLNELAPDKMPVGLSDLGGLEPKLERDEWHSLICLIGLTTEARRGMDDPIGVRQRPLFVLPDGRVLLVDLPNAMDALWDTFDTAARRDEKLYQKYQRHRTEWLEARVVQQLSRIFPARHLYRNLTYPDLDPAKPAGSQTELDAAISWGPFLVLVEAKAKQFRLESQLGDVGRLRSDLKANVEDAFEQARRAARYIDQTPNPEFIERDSGRVLSIDKSNLNRIFLLTISLQQLAGLANRLASLQELGLFKDGEYPLSISIPDLEMIAEFCEGPDVLLHYIEKRLSLNRESYVVYADELDFFGAYLDTRLHSERLWAKEGKDANTVFLGGWSEQFDKLMMFRRGELKTAPEIKLDVPPELRDILNELRERDDDAGRWIAFALLDCPDALLGRLAQTFRDLKTARLVPGRFRRLTFQEDNTVISVLASLDEPPENLRQRTTIRVAIEKYRRKVRKSIGFGIMVLDNSRPFDTATWLEGDWSYDEQYEKLLEQEPLQEFVTGQKLPSRNQPCFCGSGKKFKKCCLPHTQG